MAQEPADKDLDPAMRPFVELWASYMQQAGDAAKKMQQSCSSSADLQQWQRRWLEAAKKNMDAYLRSAPFLQAMKHNTDSLRPREGTAADDSGSVAGDKVNPTPSDAREVLQRLQSIEAAINQRLAAIEARLRDIESRLPETPLRQTTRPQRILDRQRSPKGMQRGTMTKSIMDMVLDMQKMAHDEAFRAWQQFLNAPDLQRYARDAEVAATSHDVVYEEGTLRVLRYRNEHTIGLQEPVLFCFSLVNRPYILDLQRDRSVVRQFLQRGFDVYLIDWGSPTEADCVLTLYDYVCRFLKHVVQCVCEHAQSRSLNLLGYCMGGTMSAMFTSLYQEQVRNLILLAAPIDFSGDESLLNVWTDQKYFDVDALVDSVGNCPGSFLQSTFQMMNPVQNFYEKYLGFFERMYDDSFLENFFAMERWSNDNIPVAGETFRQFVKMLYQRNLLIKGEFCLRERPVDLGQIHCPVLMLMADKDHLVPPGSTLAIKDYVRSKIVQKMSLDAGHIGLAVSSKAHRQLWPDAVDWVADHSTPRRS